MKYIKIDKKLIKNVYAELMTRMNDSFIDKVTISLPAPSKDTARPKLMFSELAWRKMQLYVETTSTEIGWEGTVERDGMNFLVTDVFLFPQSVTSVTVDVGVDEYNYYDKWSDSLQADVFNTKRLHGHSHVNMSVSPSGTDLSGEKIRVDDLHDDDFYIFVIVNKQSRIRAVIYDKVTNIQYDTEDIDFMKQSSGLLDEIEKEKENNIIEDKKDTIYIKGDLDVLREMGVMFEVEEVTLKNVVGTEYNQDVAVLKHGYSQAQKKKIQESEDFEIVKPETTTTQVSAYNYHNNHYHGNYYDKGSYYSSNYNLEDKEEDDFWTKTYKEK